MHEKRQVTDNYNRFLTPVTADLIHNIDMSVRVGVGNLMSVAAPPLFIDEGSKLTLLDAEDDTYEMVIPHSKYKIKLWKLEALTPTEVGKFQQRLLQSARELINYLSTLDNLTEAGSSDGAKKYENKSPSETTQLILSNVDPRLVMKSKVQQAMSLTHFGGRPINEILPSELWAVLNKINRQSTSSIAEDRFLTLLTKIRMKVPSFDPSDKEDTIANCMNEYWTTYVGLFQEHNFHEWDNTVNVATYFLKGITHDLLRELITKRVFEALDKKVYVKPYGQDKQFVKLDRPWSCFTHIQNLCQEFDKELSENPGVFGLSKASKYRRELRTFNPETYPNAAMHIAKGYEKERATLPPEVDRKDRKRFSNDTSPSSGSNPKKQRKATKDETKTPESDSTTSPKEPKVPADRTTMSCCLCDGKGHLAMACTVKKCWCGKTPGVMEIGATGNERPHNPFYCKESPMFKAKKQAARDAAIARAGTTTKGKPKFIKKVKKKKDE